MSVDGEGFYYGCLRRSLKLVYVIFLYHYEIFNCVLKKVCEELECLDHYECYDY